MRINAMIDKNALDNMELSITIRMPVCEWYKLMRGQDNIKCLQSKISQVLGHLTRATEIEFSIGESNDGA